MRSERGKQALRLMTVAALAAGGAAVARAQVGRGDAASDAAKPYPVGEPGRWFGAGDYPAAAMAAGEEGRTILRLAVGGDGAIQSCLVVGSSGSASLDARSCELALARGRFAPAVDDRGEPLARTYRLPVQWTMPESPESGIALRVPVPAA